MPFTRKSITTLYEITGEAPVPAAGGFHITPQFAQVTVEEGHPVAILVKGRYGKRHGNARYGRYGTPITQDTPKWIRQLEAMS